MAHSGQNVLLASVELPIALAETSSVPPEGCARFILGFEPCQADISQFAIV
jgi:hypothetical protein